MNFLYKDVSEKIPNWPFWGKLIGIVEADTKFKEEYPQFVKKNQISSTVSVTIITH